MSESRGQIGFVGAGAMGAPMICRLGAAGFTVFAYDVNTQRREALAGAPGVHAADALADLARCAITVCSLPNSAIVERVLRGPGGLFRTLRPGTMVIDVGSSEPESTIALAREAAGLGIAFADAPVSGGVSRARTGQLTVMFGGTTADLERARPVLEVIGQIVHVGQVGAGHALKSLNNLLSATSLAAATEALAVGRRCGLDPHLMVDVLNRSTGKSNATETKLEQFVIGERYESGFALRLMVKDLGIAIGLAHSLGVAIPLGESCLRVWQHAADVLPEDADQTLIATLPLRDGTTDGREERKT